MGFHIRGGYPILSMMNEIPILYLDPWYAAVHKPAGLLVHRSSIAPASQKTMLPMLREQLGKRLFPVHRLDRGTSGVMVIGLSSEAAGKLSARFEAREIEKTYLTVLRGWLWPRSGRISRPLKTWPGEPERPAATRYYTLSLSEIAIPVPPHSTSRYSLVEVHPETGRRQQIRRHFSGLSHPVIGDTSHGDQRHNRVFRDQFQAPRLFLMAVAIRFHHPFLDREITIHCPPDHQTASALTRVFPSWSGQP